MGLLAPLIVGLLAGLLAKPLMPGKDPGGFIITVLLGVGGAFLGGWLGSIFFSKPLTGGVSLYNVALATAGALLILALWRKLKG